MKQIFFILSILLISSAHAEVFKCQLKSGKTVYQSTPCQSAIKQQAIEIPKPDPRKVAEEEAKLKAWKEDFAAREAARIKAEKELQAELDRKASVEALKKSAEYQQQQAYEAKRQADALERQNMQPPQFYPNFTPIIIRLINRSRLIRPVYRINIKKPAKTMTAVTAAAQKLFLTGNKRYIKSILIETAPHL